MAQPKRRTGSFSGLQTIDNNSGSTFKVAVRVRPLLDKERKASTIQCVNVELEHKAIVINKPEDRKRIPSTQIEINDFTGLIKTSLQNSQNFFFDTVFGQSSSQENIYDECARHIVLSVLEGYNGSIIAYGQTGTGKSFTIEGGNEDNKRGLIPRSSEEIFNYIETKASKNDRFLVRVSFLEIYNEKISDLLEQNRTNLRIREDGVGGMYVENLSEHIVKSTYDIKDFIRRGTQLRTTAATRSNIESSRSHAIFTIIVEHSQSSVNGDGNIVTIGKLRLADLAGSERFDVDSQSKRQEETKHINVSLHTFGKVVMSLTSSSSNAHIPYRESKLTKILQDSIGGNCKTTMITTISPVPSSYNESLNSLKFAKRAKHVKNSAIINKDISQKALLSAYQQEIQNLREQLQNKAESDGATELVQLEKEKEMAEKQKNQVLSELEQQKLLYNKAEKEKIEFQKKIELLEAKLIHGGSNLTNTSEFKRVLQAEREKIAHDTKLEYQKMLAEIEEKQKRLEDEKAEMEKEKEQILHLRTHIKTDKQAIIQTFKKPNLPKPLLASRHTPLPVTTQQLTTNAFIRKRGPIISNTSQLPLRRPLLRATSQTMSPSSLYDSNDSYQEALQVYYKSLADPSAGIPCQELQSGIRIFTGKHAVEWFIGNMEGVASIDEAVRIGTRLIELGMISEITKGHDQFLNSESAYYQFNDQNSYYTQYNTSTSRPVSAYSMMSLLPSTVIMRQSRTASLPMVTSNLDSSVTLSSSPSLATLQLSPIDSVMDSLTNNNPTQLHIAAITGDINIVYELSKSISVNTPDSNGYTPLMYATLGCQSKCCNMLLKNLRANVNLMNDNNNTALILAVINDNSDIVRILLKNHADTHHVDINRDNVFHIAVKNGSTKCLHVLLKYSSNLSSVNERNNDYYTPLHIAVINHYHRCIIMLLNAKCDIGISDNDGQTSLHHAIHQNCNECTISIVSITPNDVNLVDINGMNPLHIASYKGYCDLVEILLQSPKCDVNMSDNDGRTPLHLAVHSNNLTIVEMLLKARANKLIKDNKNMSAEDDAYEKKYTDCLRLLKIF